MSRSLQAPHRFQSVLCAVAAGICLCPLRAEPPAAGPPPAPNVRGNIYDSTRTAIPGATITATPEGRALGQSTSSGQAGEFGLFLQPGSYEFRIAADGFKNATQTVIVGTAAPAAIEIVLDVAPRQEIVTVTESVNYQILTPNSTKTSTPLLDVPQSISVVTRNLIRDQGMQNMADVVRYVPGITMAHGEGHRDAPVIRGNATTADFYVNGVRDDVQYYRDLYNVERVEAVKGANAIAFGRGGGGGVINRVTKEAQFYPTREISLQGGSFGNKRFTTDFGQSLNDKLAFRLNGVYENSGSFRHDVNVERYGVAPTVTLKAGDRTQIKVAYEYFNDGRTVDRGIPSFAGGPSNANRSTFFGDPAINYATAGVNLGSVTIEHQIGSMNLRNSTLVGDYDKFYQNLVPGAVNANQTLVSISGYNNATQRRNLFNQTDVTGVVFTGGFRHTVLMGTEFGARDPTISVIRHISTIRPLSTCPSLIRVQIYQQCSANPHPMRTILPIIMLQRSTSRTKLSCHVIYK